MKRFLALFLVLCCLPLAIPAAHAGDPYLPCYLEGDGDTVTLYEKASTGSAVVGKFANHLVVSYDTEAYTGKWVKVRLARGQYAEGYTRTDQLLSLYDKNTPALDAKLEKAQVKQNAALFSGKGKKAKKVGVLNAGATVFLLGDCGSFYYVSVYGTKASGYMKKSDLKKTGASGTLNEKISALQTATVYTQTEDATDAATLYTSCCTFDASYSFVLSNDTQVGVVARLNDWTLVVYETEKGVVYSGYLETRFLDPAGDHALKIAYVKTSDADNRLNLRAAPDQDAMYSMKLFGGTLLYVIAEDDEWAEVRVEKSVKTGYVMKKYLTDTLRPVYDVRPKARVTGSSSLTVTAYDHLGQRLYNGSTVCAVSPGDEVTVLGAAEDCLFVMIEPTLCGFLTLNVLEPIDSSYVKTATVHYDTLRLRETPDTDSAALDSMSRGTKVKVLLHGDVWSKIEYKGQTGYVMTRYLKF